MAVKTVSEETLRFRLALDSLKKQLKSSKKRTKILAKERDYVEAFRSDQSCSGLNWAIGHIEYHLRRKL